MKYWLLIFALILPATVQATDRYASPAGSGSTCSSGSPCSIATGIAATLSGDTLYLRAGTYDARFSVISGVTIAGYPSDARPLIKPSSGSGGMVNMTSANGFTLRYLEISGQGLTMSDSCVGGSPTNAILDDLIVHDCVRGPGGSDSTGVGIVIGGSGNTLRRIESYNNDSSDPSAAGDNGGYGIYLSGTNSVIEYGYFHNNGGEGLQPYPAGGNTIRFNRIYHNGWTNRKNLGAIFAGGPGNLIYGNVIWDNRWSGIDSYNGGTFYNNTIYSNGLTTGAGGITILSGNATVRNNIIVNSGGGNIVDNPGGITASNNLCFGSGGGSNCSMTGQDPLFVNPGTASTSNFQLQATSPAINAGTPLAAPYNVDINGTPRPQGATFDLGAYEYGAPAPPVNQMVVALPLDEGIGTTATDVSGQKNNATLMGGATWDNAGKYGKAVMLDGTGYLNIAPAQSLALAPAMTLEAWIYPTTAFSGLAAVIVQDRYYLYAASDAGQCGAPVLAPLGGYSTTSSQHYLCATTTPPPNQWSHLAVVHDGLTTTFYLNGAPIASQTSTDPMVATAQNMLIGASNFGEYFIGKIDQPMVYNYSRTPGQILSDANTPLIGAPGKYVEIAAPVSVEISAASSIEIAAD